MTYYEPRERRESTVLNPRQEQFPSDDNTQSMTESQRIRDEGASNMKAAILQRVREKADQHEGYAKAHSANRNEYSAGRQWGKVEVLRQLATELESIQLKDEDNNEQS